MELEFNKSIMHGEYVCCKLFSTLFKQNNYISDEVNKLVIITYSMTLQHLAIGCTPMKVFYLFEFDYTYFQPEADLCDMFIVLRAIYWRTKVLLARECTGSNFAQRPIFSGLRLFSVSEISD